nr:hypothetical protein [Azospirillum sp. SYSU D00513]
MLDIHEQQHRRTWSLLREGQETKEVQVADFSRDGQRIVAFLDNDVPAGGATNPWPLIAESYAREQEIGLADARWYNVSPRRFANGRPNITEYLAHNKSWKFETNLNLARDIIRSLGFDPDNLPLDI